MNQATMVVAGTAHRLSDGLSRRCQPARAQLVDLYLASCLFTLSFAINMALEYVIDIVFGRDRAERSRRSRMGQLGYPEFVSGRKPHSKRREETRGWQGAERELAIPSWPRIETSRRLHEHGAAADIVTTPQTLAPWLHRFLLALVPVPEKARGLLLRMFPTPTCSSRATALS